ncbi:SPFH domain-containing protein [Polynucleobacter paneuropaeus]|nr:SPFH domain-containing protein [Polynucleobacter paneuropaeus]
MAIIDLVKWNGTADAIAWKFPSEQLSTWTQLIVNESQEAYVVSGGVYDGPFLAGRHILKTENLPVIRTFLGLAFGGQSPFTAEVWYVNKAVNLDIKWGTPDPIQLKDPMYQIMVPIRAFGQYGIKIIDSKKFLLKLVGTLTKFDSKALSEYFRGVFLSKIKVEIATNIIKQGISVLEISTDLTRISSDLRETLNNDVLEYGVELVQFNILSINVPEDDPAVISLKNALAKKAEMGIIGFNYQQEKSNEILLAAAGNQGMSGGIMGIGLGAGVGAALGGGLAQSMAGVANSVNINPVENASPQQPSKVNTVDKIAFLKELAELKSQGILSEEEFQQEKKKILG